MAKIYVASSWRNHAQPGVVVMLRELGHEVYDFRNPANGEELRTGARGTGTGFQWSEIDKDWQKWTAKQYRTALDHPLAEKGFHFDFDAMKWADICILVLPSGRSAHLEAGWCAGRGKPVYVLTQDGEEPELMAKMCTAICTDWSELQQALAKAPDQDREPTPAEAAKIMPMGGRYECMTCGGDVRGCMC